MLDKQQTNVNEIDSLRKWQYLPIFEYTLKKFHFSQNVQLEQAPVLNPPQLERLNTPSPIDQDMLQISNDEPEFDSGDELDSESLTAEVNRVDSYFCTTYHCTKSENNAQCTDPIHNV